MTEKQFGWSIRAYSQAILDVFGMEAELFALQEVIKDVKAKSPNGGEVFWRIVDADEASWLCGAEAFKHPNRIFFYAFQGEDAIAQARGYAQ
jgi:hypothetical protein